MKIITRPAALFLVLANLALWVFFWTDFSSRLVPYKEQPLVFEENVPVLVFWGEALPVEQIRSTSLRIIEWVQAPSFLVVRPVVYALNRKPSFWGNTLGGLSPWSYLLLVVMVLSFVQWYFVGWALGKFYSKWFGRPAGTNQASV
jgi:hypothetical protein